MEPEKQKAREPRLKRATPSTVRPEPVEGLPRALIQNH
ncbi:hypothetical protein HCH_03809 [Hahella chejuensis KCTC 2396]|uniref:Uncharacterized protein n=1 Tax=Hahella chejuensis (strain KCTC 2396) TaxID=349521 RepID=Q2SFN4_HAHCH|nr:hypothetical protein HCH_03809 [Hahella chejuensis KCTC 2396]